LLIDTAQKMRVLWFNWRDIKHPDAGGAEVLTHEVMLRLARIGYDITLFCPSIPSGMNKEEIDGVEIIRSGGKYTVYSKAKEFYKSNKNQYDLVIDEINAKPFLSPDLVRGKPILALFHQLIHEEWFYETRFPLNYICYYYLERKWLSSYKDIPTATVSASSEQDLKAYGFKRVFIIPMGLSVEPIEKVEEKEPTPTFVFIGRLKRHKLADHALRAFALIKEKLPDSKMWVIGDGTMRKELEKMNLKDVIFYGHVKNELKYRLLRKAHIVLMPSVREGWGLVVTESNAMGTPVVAYNVPGLRDSVIDGKTGVLVNDNSPKNLASASVSLLADRDLLKKYSNDALAFSTQFSWDNTASAFDKIITELE
jgi:glycosyltransferase involved in cell wall biosynthesis